VRPVRGRLLGGEKMAVLCRECYLCVRNNTLPM
jgi:hypothetical protein